MYFRRLVFQQASSLRNWNHSYRAKGYRSLRKIHVKIEWQTLIPPGFRDCVDLYPARSEMRRLKNRIIPGNCVLNFVSAEDVETGIQTNVSFLTASSILSIFFNRVEVARSLRPWLVHKCGRQQPGLPTRDQRT